jgi:hypothetical protein
VGKINGLANRLRGEAARTSIKPTAPGTFTARDLRVVIDLGLPIPLNYFDRRLYAFEGKILAVSVQLK